MISNNNVLFFRKFLYTCPDLVIKNCKLLIFIGIIFCIKRIFVWIIRAIEMYGGDIAISIVGKYLLIYTDTKYHFDVSEYY